jgi:hypothetical protein
MDMHSDVQVHGINLLAGTRTKMFPASKTQYLMPAQAGGRNSAVVSMRQCFRPVLSNHYARFWMSEEMSWFFVDLCFALQSLFDRPSPSQKTKPD